MAANGGLKEGEAQPTRADLKRQLKEIAEKLSRTEGQRRSGARERTPRSRMLDASALEGKDKDHHYRYNNTDDPGQIQIATDDGYVAVPEAEAEAAGVRAQVGELRLMRVPREKHEEELARQHELHQSRLKAHRTEVRGAVEAVVKELRDHHGLNVSVERLLVDE
jgi:hypothetical protein